MNNKRKTDGRYKFQCLIDGRTSQSFRMNVQPIGACPGLNTAAQEMAAHIVEKHPSGGSIEMKRIGWSEAGDEEA